MTSAELCQLCQEYYSDNSPGKSIEPISRFFSKLINDNKTIDMTPKLKTYIPALAKERNGALLTMLNATINVLSPTDYVPQLDLKTALIEPHEPSERAHSAHRPVPAVSVLLRSPTLSFHLVSIALH